MRRLAILGKAVLFWAVFFVVLQGAVAAQGPWPLLEDVRASAYIVVDADTGEQILGQNVEGEVYPASMTKILTALVVLSSEDYDPLKPVRFSEIACQMPAAESATAGFVPGEEASTLVCLYAMMTRSANEVANALAETYGGSIEGFVALMNEKAKELGCTGSHFVDPCGFGYVDHHTTAQDMVKITKAAMAYPLFQDLVTTKHYSLPATNKHPMAAWGHLFNSNYLMLFYDAGYQSPYLLSIDGVKTGNTDLAGDCLTAAATTHDGRHLISVIFKAGYAGAYPNSFVGPALLSRTLLEEAAKMVGSPAVEGELAAEKNPWATIPGVTEERVTEQTEEPTALFTRTAAPSTAPLPSEKTEIKKSHLATLIVGLGLALLFLMLAAYALFFDERRKLRQYPPE